MPLSHIRRADAHTSPLAVSDRAARLPASPAKRLLAGLTVGLLGLGMGACDLRVGAGAPDTLPTMTQAQSARDALARRALLIASAAQHVSSSHSQADDTVRTLAGRLAQDATAQAQALGGMWQPWPSDAPTDLPTATALATATPGTTATALLSILADGVAQAREDLSHPDLLDHAQALATASVAVAWARDAASLAAALGVDLPRSVTGRARTSAPTEATQAAGSLLACYDEARYAMEEVAARSQGTERDRPASDAMTARAVVSALVAAGVPETRLGAYGRDDESDAAWAQRVWLAVAAAEIHAAGAQGSVASASTHGQETASSTDPVISSSASPAVSTAAPQGGDASSSTDATVALDAAIDAVTRAVAWGTQSTPSLPGLAG